MRQDSAYHWVVGGHRTAAPQEFPLLFYGAPFWNWLPTVKQDESWIHALKHTEMPVRAHVDTRKHTRVQVMLMYISSMCVLKEGGKYYSDLP